jgi:hypothetical protein
LLLVADLLDDNPCPLRRAGGETICLRSAAFFVERVNKPTDNKPWRCFGKMTDGHSCRIEDDPTPGPKVRSRKTAVTYSSW